MSSTNKTTYYELSQYIGTDKPTYLGDYNSDMLAIDTAIHNAADAASTAVSTANSAASAATAASTAASTATTTANTAKDTADSAAATAATANTNAAAALTAAQGAQTAAAANTITNLAPAYDAVAGTYVVGDLVTHIDDQGSGKLYKNIVPIETPHAFNINEWDDVTTSEVYGTKRKVLARVVADGIKSRSELLDELYNLINDPSARYDILMTSSTNQITNYIQGQTSASQITFFRASAGTSTFDIFDVTLKSSGSLMIRWSTDVNGSSVTDLSDDVWTADSMIIEAVTI